MQVNPVQVDPVQKRAHQGHRLIPFALLQSLAQRPLDGFGILRGQGRTVGAASGRW